MSKNQRNPINKIELRDLKQQRNEVTERERERYHCCKRQKDGMINPKNEEDD